MTKHKITQVNEKVYTALFELKKYPFEGDDIAKTVATIFGVSVEDMQSSSRKRKYVIPRQIAIFFMRHITKIPLKDMAYFFGGRDHTTAIHSINTVHDLMDTNPDYRNDLLEIAAKLTQLYKTPV